MRPLNQSVEPTGVPGQRASLFSTREWFELWAASFADKRYQFDALRRPSSANAFPHFRSAVRILGFKLDVAWSAQNHHTPRYDVLDRSSSLDFDEMFDQLNVSLLTFHRVSSHSIVYSAAANYDRARTHFEWLETSPFVDCTLEWNFYWKSRGKNLRSNLAGLVRRTQALTEVNVLRTRSDIAAARDVIYAIEASGWKGRRGTAMSQQTHVQHFYDTLMDSFAERDLIRLFVLKLSGEPIAFELCTLYNGVLTGLKGGYLEAYASYSPGQLLRYWFLQEAFRDSMIVYYDMLGPSSETKLRWATGTEDLLTVRVFRNSLDGRLARFRYVTMRELAGRLKHGRRFVSTQCLALRAAMTTHSFR